MSGKGKERRGKDDPLRGQVRMKKNRAEVRVPKSKDDPLRGQVSRKKRTSKGGLGKADWERRRCYEISAFVDKC